MFYVYGIFSTNGMKIKERGQKRLKPWLYTYRLIYAFPWGWEFLYIHLKMFILQLYLSIQVLNIMKSWIKSIFKDSFKVSIQSLFGSVHMFTLWFVAKSYVSKFYKPSEWTRRVLLVNRHKLYQRLQTTNLMAYFRNK
jgi:hypothetical protein